MIDNIMLCKPARRKNQHHAALKMTGYIENISRICTIWTLIIPNGNKSGSKNPLPGGHICVKHVMTKPLETKSSGKVIMRWVWGKYSHCILIYMMQMGITS